METAIQAVRLGARDYLTKPAEPEVILSRVAELLAENEQPAPRHVTLNGRYIPVPGIYFDYLATLLRHAPKAVAYETLVKESQGFDVGVAEAKDLARWRIHELRKIIETDPERPQYIMPPVTNCASRSVKRRNL